MPELKWTAVDGKDAFQGSSEVKDGEVHIAHALSGTIASVKAEMNLSVDPDEKIFMNGFQTWTYCPEYSTDKKTHGLKGIPSFLVKKYHFDGYGDYHFVSYPEKKGVTHGFSWCTFRKGGTFRLIGSLNEEPGYTMFTYDANTQKLTMERDCSGVEVSGSYALFDLFFAKGSEQEVYDAWFMAMGVKPLQNQKLYGYSSWYNRYQNITEEAVLSDLKGCREIFAQGDLFQIDDGWEPFVGDWLQPDPVKFPNGMKAMVDQIHAAGFRAGLWLAPYVAETKSKLYQEHQDWFLKVNGENWYNGSNWSGFCSLDIDNPEVTAYLKQVFQRVYDEWGFDLVKLDFLYGAAPFGTKKETRAGRMIRAMKFMRELAGENHEILGCGVPVMPAFGLVEYCRVSCDVSLDWNDVWYMQHMHRERTSTKQAIETTTARRALNRRAYLSDPDVFFLRSENCKLTDAQKDLLASVCALEGGVFLTSDDPGSYTPGMKEKYQKYRHLSEAKNVSVTTDNGLHITYTLDGKTETLDFKEW